MNAKTTQRLAMAKRMRRRERERTSRCRQRRRMPTGEVLLCKPTIAEAPAITELVNRFAKKGAMLPRALADVRERIRDFTICESDGRMIGCVALHVLWEDLGEIRSLAVVGHAQKQGVGTRLVEFCLREAQTLGIARVMTLTYAKAFFRKFGFREHPKQALPQKVWKDCVNCPRFPHCDETAMVLHLEIMASGGNIHPTVGKLGKANGATRK